MLLSRERIHLIFQHFQSPYQLGSGLPGVNHIVYIPLRGSYIRIGKLVPVFPDELLARLLRIIGPGNLTPEDDVHSPIRAITAISAVGQA